MADFVSQFDVIAEKKVECNQSKDPYFIPEDEKQEEDEDEVELQYTDPLQVDQYPMRNGAILRKRKTQKIIRYVRFSKEQDAENFSQEQLMLFYPWRNEATDLIGWCTSYEEHFNQKIDKIKVNKMKYEVDNSIIDVVVGDLAEFDENLHVIAPEVQHMEESDQNETTNENENVFHGCFNPRDMGQEYDIGVDFDITRYNK